MPTKFHAGIFLFLLGLLQAHAALVLDESLQGTTTGTRSGGTFVAGGWLVTGKNDSIYWHVPTITNGAVEWSIRGLAPNECRAGMEDKTEIFHMYDYTSNDSDNSYAPGYRDNPFKHFVRKTGCLDTARVNSMEILWLIGANFLEGDSPVISWNTNTVYVFREEWGPDGAGNSTLKTYRDGALILTQTVPGSYAPTGHSIRIGASTRRDAAAGAPLGATFSNVKVWDLSNATPAPPTITEPANGQTVNRPIVFLKWNGGLHTHYQARITRVNDPDSSIAWDSGDVTSDRNYAMTAALTDLNTYYVFVRLSAGAAWSPWSSAGRQFAVDSRFVPTGQNVVRVTGNSLSDKSGPFLGLGATYFQALRRAKYDRPRLTNDLALLVAKGFNYVRVLSMVNWDGLEIAPVSFVNSAGHSVTGWTDYWQQFRDLLDIIASQGLRAEVTVFADAQYVMPNKSTRQAHLDGILANIAGRERKIIHLEVANEAWQNGFPGAQGVADLREFAQYLGDRTTVPVAITSNDDLSDAGITSLYSGSAADLATIHFSRDIGTPEGGWLPVRDCYRAANLPGVPPVSSNEPIGPGSSVSSENDPIKLCAAAVFAWIANLPSYVYHSRAGVSGYVSCCPPSGGEVRFEDTAGINAYQFIRQILPPDLSSWVRNDGLETTAPFTIFCNGQANRYWPDVVGATNGCDRNIGSAKGREFVCFPMGILARGVTLQARRPIKFQVYNPLSGAVVSNITLNVGSQVNLPQGPSAYIIKGVFQDMNTPLVPRGAAWKYLDNGSNQDTAWRQLGFNDTLWASGPAKLGYGEGNEATLLSYGPDPTNKFVTTYFRRSFLVSNPGAFTNLVLRVLRDDGAVVFLNGAEVFRSNMPTGAVSSTTFASSVVAAPDESAFFSTNLNPLVLSNGINLLAVEIHQANAGSSDLSFDLELQGAGNSPPVSIVTDPTQNLALDASGTISLSAQAWDNDGLVSRVEFFVDGVKVGEDSAPPFGTTWTNLPIGNYTLTIVATDDAGTASSSTPITFTVRNLLVPKGSVWRFLDNGSNQGTAWRAINFADDPWPAGPAELGYGDGDEATLISFGPSDANKFVTTYFRRSFFPPPLSNVTNLALRVLRDDGAIVYLNDVEIFRSNMPTGVVSYLTNAISAVGGTDETTFFATNVSPSRLVTGKNVIAVELHQANATSTDVSFDLELVAEAPLPPLPRLTALKSGANVTLSWPASTFGFHIQSAASLTNAWADAGYMVTNGAGIYAASLLASNAHQFFRLKKP